jgi:hypothetical protein
MAQNQHFYVALDSSVLVATLGKAYGWQQTDMAVLTINAIATFLGVVTGVSAYNLKDKE